MLFCSVGFSDELCVILPVCLKVTLMFVFHNMCIIKIKCIPHLNKTYCSLWQRFYVLFVIGSVFGLRR